MINRNSHQWFGLAVLNNLYSNQRCGLVVLNNRYSNQRCGLVVLNNRYSNQRCGLVVLNDRLFKSAVMVVEIPTRPQGQSSLGRHRMAMPDRPGGGPLVDLTYHRAHPPPWVTAHLVSCSSHNVYLLLEGFDWVFLSR